MESRVDRRTENQCFVQLMIRQVATRHRQHARHLENGGQVGTPGHAAATTLYHPSSLVIRVSSWMISPVAGGESTRVYMEITLCYKRMT